MLLSPLSITVRSKSSAQCPVLTVSNTRQPFISMWQQAATVPLTFNRQLSFYRCQHCKQTGGNCPSTGVNTVNRQATNCPSTGVNTVNRQAATVPSTGVNTVNRWQLFLYKC